MAKDIQNPGNLNDDPNQNPEPKTVEEQLAEMTAKTDALVAENQEKDKVITDLGTTVATLKTRVVEPQAPAPIADEGLRIKAKDIMSKAIDDPEKAGEDLADLLNKSRQGQPDLNATAAMVQNAVSSMQYVEKIKKDNPELLPYEKLMTSRVDSMLGRINSKTGKPYELKEAIDVVVEEVKVINKTVNKESKAPVPSGAAGEGGTRLGNPPPPVDDNQGESQQQSVDGRRDVQNSKIL